MGLFSKLFGDNKDGKNALDQAKGLFNEAGKSLGDLANTAEKMGAAFKEGFEQERQGGGTSASFAAEETAQQGKEDQRRGLDDICLDDILLHDILLSL